MGNCAIKYSPIESKRFGLRMYRGQYEKFDITDVVDLIHKNDFDIIIVRYPSITIHEHYKLVGIEGCKTIHADSLVYYDAPLQKIEIQPLRNNLQFDVVNSQSDKNLDSLVERIFTGYQNHYYSNPCLRRSDIIEGYIEWAKSFATTNENGVTWLIKDASSKETVAFLACSIDKIASVSELKLGGVLPEFAGKGIYSDFVRYAQRYFKDLGICSLITSTQLQNVNVQRAWQKLGFHFDKSYETYHIIKDSVWNIKPL